jgi:hypothetical protein
VDQSDPKIITREKEANLERNLMVNMNLTKIIVSGERVPKDQKIKYVSSTLPIKNLIVTIASQLYLSLNDVCIATKSKDQDVFEIKGDDRALPVSAFADCEGVASFLIFSMKSAEELVSDESDGP